VSKTVKRIKHLIALAVSPTANENEARNAAFLAVKLLHEHDIDLLDPTDEVADLDGFPDLGTWFQNFTRERQRTPQGPPRAAVSDMFKNVRKRRPPEPPAPPPPAPEPQRRWSENPTISDEELARMLDLDDPPK
jgi:hypothetical protein